MKRTIFFSAVILAMSACSPADVEKAGNEMGRPRAQQVVFHQATADEGLSDYWYQGKAEVTSYELSQNRYRDVHPGEAILIFVTEDFLTDKLVKNDNYSNPNSIPILKANMVRKFPTGIYDYSMMTSVFTPTETSAYPQTLKVSNSSQEWCGHTYMQVNKVGQGYNMTLHSYFENEADKIVIAPDAMFEDEMYNRIRMNPAGLPKGNIELFPSLTVTRLMHLSFKKLPAIAKTGAYAGRDFKGRNLRVYSLEYPSIQRTLEIVFEAEEPYRIVGWKDVYPSAFDGLPRVTLAKRKKSILSDYWKQNGLEDMRMRKELNLD